MTWFAASDPDRATSTETEHAVLHVFSTGFDLAEPPNGPTMPSWALPFIAGLVVSVAILALLVVVSRRRVAVTTRELQRLDEDLEATVRSRTEALTASNRALSRFAASAAHDLKGPVAGIASLLELLVDDGVPDELADDLLLLGATATRLSTMIDAMLEDALRVGTPVDFVDGRGFVTWLNEVTDLELGLIDGELRIDVPAGPLDIDAEMLRRTVLNLVSNAIKYAAGDQPTIISVELHRSPGEWCLVVADNGGGIDRSQWSEIFEYGSQVAPDNRGFGLGLATIRDLVQNVGGSISVGDADLGGAAFTVTLPHRRTARAGLQQLEPLGARG